MNKATQMAHEDGFTGISFESLDTRREMSDDTARAVLVGCYAAMLGEAGEVLREIVRGGENKDYMLLRASILIKRLYGEEQ